MKRFFLFLVITVLGITGHAQQLERDQLLDKMIEVYGGEQALEKAYSFTQEWEVTAQMSGEKGTDYRKVSLPDSLYIDLNYPSRSETRILQKGHGVKITNKTNTRVAQGPMLDAMKLQLMRLYNPLVLKRQAGAIQLSTRDNHYVLSLPQDGLVTDYYVDPKTFYITTVVGTLSMGGQSMSFVTRYSDHKMAEGVLMPHHEVKYAGNVNTAVLELKSVRFVTADEIPSAPQNISL